MLQLKNLTIDANITAAGATHVGLRRSQNEDAFLIDPANGLIALADGIGGQEAGDVASSEAINALQEYLEKSLVIKKEIGDILECLTPHCYATLNLYTVYHCVRSDTLVDIWSIDARDQS